jgi:peptidoglycan/xylan/chitin deacetylase (PgdA/CDA1 family)
MYHGVTQSDYQPPVWTQLPITIFKKQVEWLAQNYNPVTLSQVVAAIKGGDNLPPKSVLLTFDDGLKNNYTVAFPILKQFEVPAAIFLTVDFIDSERFFWVDELYLALVSAHEQGKTIVLSHREAKSKVKAGHLWEAYLTMVEFLKRIPEKDRILRMKAILDQVSIERERYQNDFGLLSWKNVIEMEKSNLIEFGAHTANHRILTSIPDEELTDELFGAKERLEEHLSHKVTSFCYPNGGFGKDYLPKHREMLQAAGYDCAFSTNRGLFINGIDHPFSIPRVAAGHDISSEEAYFKINVSGRAEWQHDKLRRLVNN